MKGHARGMKRDCRFRTNLTLTALARGAPVQRLQEATVREDIMISLWQHLKRTLLSFSIILRTMICPERIFAKCISGLPQQDSMLPRFLHVWDALKKRFRMHSLPMIILQDIF